MRRSARPPNAPCARPISCWSACRRTWFDRRGALQREIRQALDLREEMLPGDIYVIPVRLRPCEMPDSLREVLPVDLFEPNGFDRLLVRSGSGQSNVRRNRYRQSTRQTT